MDHVVDLAAGWRVWRWACLRGAGFPADLILTLSSRPLAEAADALARAADQVTQARDAAMAALRRVGAAPGDREDPAAKERARRLRDARKLAWDLRPPRDTGTDADVELAALRDALAARDAADADLRAAYERARVEGIAAAQRVAADPRFREAVTWQNRQAVTTALDSLRAIDPRDARTKDRARETLVASYLQRYAVKNDTIGFFGPVGWATLTRDVAALEVRPGPSFVAARRVFFEQWGIDVLAARASADPRLERWMRPRRLPFVTIEGSRAQSPVNGSHDLSSEELAVLQASNGERTPAELAPLAAPHDVMEILRGLRERKLVVWSFEVPLTWEPNITLRRVLGAIDDETLRAEALRPLDELESARAAVEAAAGDATKLADALTNLESTFVGETGESATRNAGAMYAARQLVFEDCRRDLDAHVGAHVLDDLGAPLSLVLSSARWFTSALGTAYRDAIRRTYDTVARRRRGADVRFADVWFAAQRLFVGAKERPVDAVAAELEQRWLRVLPIDGEARRVDLTSSALREAVDREFAASHRGWRDARHHCPDIMIAARSADALARGEYTLVLGEVHVSSLTIDYSSFLAQHADPRALCDAYAADMPEPLVMPVATKDLNRMTVGGIRAFVAPGSYELETGFDRAAGSRDRVLSLGDLVVREVDGRHVVPLPDGTSMDMFEVFGRILSSVAAIHFRIVPKRAHTPRITIDRLVVARESWTIAPSTMPFAFEDDEPARFAKARQWAREQKMPRFSFVKAPFEVKPLFVDFDSPVYVNMLAKLARKAKEQVTGEASITLSEMLPDVDDVWLPDASNARYTSEIRIVVVDDAPVLPHA